MSGIDQWYCGENEWQVVHTSAVHTCWATLVSAGTLSRFIWPLVIIFCINVCTLVCAIKCVNTGDNVYVCAFVVNSIHLNCCCSSIRLYCHVLDMSVSDDKSKEHGIKCNVSEGDVEDEGVVEAVWSIFNFFDDCIAEVVDIESVIAAEVDDIAGVESTEEVESIGGERNAVEGIGNKKMVVGNNISN